MNPQNIKDKFSFYVEEQFAKTRLDKFLASQLGELSRSKIKNLIENGFVISGTDKKIYKGDYKVSSDEIITISIPEKEIPDIDGTNIDFKIIYEDEYLAIINKPAGITVHPGAGTANDTLIHGLVTKFGNNLSDVGGKDRLGIVHRLDKNTSGLMIIAKENHTHLQLVEMIQNREIKRFYLAVVLGLPKPHSGLIQKNIGRTRTDRKKMGVVAFGGKTAITHYNVTEIFKNGSAALVECELETGRTHQIRVHLSNLGHPILGDPDYGNFRTYKLQALGSEVMDYLHKLHRQALHAYRLELIHPRTQKKLSFQTSLPNDINILINLLRPVNAK